MTKNDTYVTVLSNNSTNIYPMNTSYNFRNELSKECDFSDSDYEVGLVSMGLSLKEIPEKKHSFSPSNTEKITMLIPRESSDSIHIDGKVDLLLPTYNFINMLNAKTNLFNFATFTINVNEYDEEYIGINVSIPEDGVLLLDTNLSQILGFEQTMFRNGKHLSKNAFNKSFLKKVKGDSVIKYIKFEEKLIDIKEPKDESLDSIAEALHESFEAGGEEVLFMVNDNQTIMSVECKKDHFRFKFPPTIEDFFELGQNTLFVNTGEVITIKIPGNLPGEAQECIYISTNLVEHQIIGSREMQVIRICELDSGAIKGRTVRNFIPVQYYPLAQPRFSSISCSLAISSNRFQIDTYPINLVFHIRQVKW